MSWHCKRNGSYTRSSQEAYDNCLEIYGILSSLGLLEEGILRNFASKQNDDESEKCMLGGDSDSIGRLFGKE